MANRTTLVDNNTWNNSHIALVGKAMSSNETAAYEIMRELDVDYVLGELSFHSQVVSDAPEVLTVSMRYEVRLDSPFLSLSVIFGGLIGYSGDDINKFLWMVRIAEGEHPKVNLRLNHGICWYAMREGTHEPFMNVNVFHLLPNFRLFKGHSRGRLLDTGRQLSRRLCRLRNYAQLSHVQTLILSIRRIATGFQISCRL